MQLRNEADKIGSNIEDYLDNLDHLLDQKVSSIEMLREKIHQIKGYLRESKKIEEQYAHMERQAYQQQEDCLLDDDEELFV
jgi:flagellar biosynthesis chaperone FliJ